MALVTFTTLNDILVDNTHYTSLQEALAANVAHQDLEAGLSAYVGGLLQANSNLTTDLAAANVTKTEQEQSFITQFASVNSELNNVKTELAEVKTSLKEHQTISDECLAQASPILVQLAGATEGAAKDLVTQLLQVLAVVAAGPAGRKIAELEAIKQKALTEAQEADAKIAAIRAAT